MNLKKEAPDNKQVKSQGSPKVTVHYRNLKTTLFNFNFKKHKNMEFMIFENVNFDRRRSQKMSIPGVSCLSRSTLRA